MILAVGAIAILYSRSGLEFFETLIGCCLLFGLLFIIFGLIMLRRMKLEYIAYRWKTLENMLNESEDLKEKLKWEPLEKTVVEKLQKGYYLKEEKWGYFPLCGVIYILILRFSFLQLQSFFLSHRITDLLLAILTVVGITIHFIFAWKILSKPIKF